MLHLFRGRRPKASESPPLEHFVLAHARDAGPIQCPLILVSQISRSGGTLLSQLFDHHPQVWAHPFELKIGYPDKWNWPDLSHVHDVDSAWEILRYAKAEARFGRGSYFKGTGQTRPMLFGAELQAAIFRQIAAATKPETDRAWIDAYFTSFFGAWLDYQRRYGEKRYVTAFASMLALEADSMTRFNATYPDGILISVLREPLGWYASVKQRSAGREKPNGKEKSRTKSHYTGEKEAEAAYLKNVQAMRNNRALLGERFLLLDFEALTRDTEATMRDLATRLGLEWHPSLAHQTFNGMDMEPNSSFQGAAKTLRSTALSEEEASRIEQGPMMAAYRSLAAESFAKDQAPSLLSA